MEFVEAVLFLLVSILLVVAVFLLLRSRKYKFLFAVNKVLKRVVIETSLKDIEFSLNEDNYDLRVYKGTNIVVDFERVNEKLIIRPQPATKLVGKYKSDTVEFKQLVLDPENGYEIITLRLTGLHNSKILFEIDLKHGG